jgi:hypothetical protein
LPPRPITHIRHPDYTTSEYEDRNAGKPWSEMDVQDLHDFAEKMTLAGLASYLMRSRQEVREKLESLGYRVGARPPSRITRATPKR